jgi:CTP:molybdopterin cytidylyltransferase MocA
LLSIVRLYRSLGFPVAIVTTPPLREAYAAAVIGIEEVHWIVVAAGEGTARTVTAALTGLADSATHLWLHPVDLPGVALETLRELEMRSRANPQAVLVPEYEGQPGHPVVLPSRPFAALEPNVPPGAMRPWLLELTRPGPDQLAPLLAVPLTDAGVIRDYDDPEALA